MAPLPDSFLCFALQIFCLIQAFDFFNGLQTLHINDHFYMNEVQNQSWKN